MAKIKYSGVYYRPEDTQVAIAGWYIDKITITNTTFPFKLVKYEVDRIRFDTREEAEAYEAELFELRMKDCDDE